MRTLEPAASAGRCYRLRARAPILADPDIGCEFDNEGRERIAGRLAVTPSLLRGREGEHVRGGDGRDIEGVAALPFGVAVKLGSVQSGISSDRKLRPVQNTENLKEQ